MNIVPGDKIGRYEIVKQIGKGGMGAVFQALDPLLTRYVAIKVLQPEYGKIVDFQQRFKREAQTLAKLKHPNILPIHDYGEEGSGEERYAYLVTMYLPEGSLKEKLEVQKLQAQKFFSTQKVLPLAIQLLEGLSYAHDQGFIHRDIKPGNILFNDDGTLVLSDFGIVKILASDGSLKYDLTPPGHLLGTPAYMAPELSLPRQAEASPQSDLYSVGVTLYQMLTGNHPFIEERQWLRRTHIYVRDVPRPIREFNALVPLSLEYIVLKVLEKDPQQRYQSASNLLNDLKAVELKKPFDTDPVEPSQPTPTQPVPSQPTPTQPVPSQPTPTQPVPSQPTPTQPVPSQKQLKRKKPLWYLISVSIVLIIILIGGTFLFPGIAVKIIPPLINLFPHSQVIKIAVDAPLSGVYKESGTQIADGAKFAIDQVNSMNLIPGYTLEEYISPSNPNLPGLDDKFDPIKGKENVQEAMGDALTAAIIGPYNSGVAEQELPITNPEPIAQISPANTNPCLTKDTAQAGCTGNNDLLPMLRPTHRVTYFRLPATDELTVKALTAFLRAKSYRTAYVVYNEDFYSQTFSQLFITEWKKAGGTFIGVAHAPGDADTQTYADQFQLLPTQTSADVVFFAGTMPAAARVKMAMAQVPQLSKAAFVGGAGIMLSAFVQAAQGGGPVFASVPVEETHATQEFQTDFLSSGYQPDNYGPYTGSANDCVLIITRAINMALGRGILPPRGSWDMQGANAFRQAIIDAIASISRDNMTGMGNLFLTTNFQSFDGSGDNTTPYLSIYSLSGNTWNLEENDNLINS